MIASRLGLLVVTALALVLAAILAIDLARDTAPPSRALVALDTTQVTKLAWTRPGEPLIVLEKTGTQWRWTAPIQGVPADAAGVDSTLSALRGGRWHRRADRGQAGVARATLAVTAGSRTVTLHVGAPLAGAGQTWIAIGDAAYLVDDWIARALAPEPLALRETRPLRDAASAATIVIDRPGEVGLRVEGARLVKPKALLLAPAALGELHRALAALAIVATPSQPTGEVVMAISMAGTPLVTVEILARGCVDPQVAIGGTAGTGCIAAADHERLVRAIDALARLDAKDLADPRLVPFEPITITLADGAVIDLKAKPRVGDRDADPAAVAELVAVLQTPAPLGDAAGTPTGTLVVTDRGGAQTTIELLPGKQLRRRGEPVAVTVGDGAWAIVTRGASAYRDPRLWTEEASTIQSITITNTLTQKAITYTRGAVLGEWSGDKDDVVTALAASLAQLRASAHLVVAPQALLEIAVEVVPPAGAPVTRTLRLSLARCAATVDGNHVLLAREICTHVGKLGP